MEQPRLYIYYIRKDKKPMMKFQAALLYFISFLAIFLLLVFQINRVHSLIFISLYIALIIFWIVSLFISIRKSNKKIKNARLEINNEQVILYNAAEVQDSIHLTDIENIKRTRLGIKLESKNVTRFDVFISRNYERIDEIETLIAERVKAMVV
jgi:Ca2+/Na+ antiporter